MRGSAGLGSMHMGSCGARRRQVGSRSHLMRCALHDTVLEHAHAVRRVHGHAVEQPQVRDGAAHSALVHQAQRVVGKQVRKARGRGLVRGGEAQRDALLQHALQPWHRHRRIARLAQPQRHRSVHVRAADVAERGRVALYACRRECARTA
jgi:hypothetical protein